MRLNIFLFSIIVYGFSCSIVSAGSLEIHLTAIEGTPVEHVNEVCTNMGMPVALALVYVSEPGWRICELDCEIVNTYCESGCEFDISEVYWTHDWFLGAQCEITPEGNVHISASDFGCSGDIDGQQPGIIVGNIIYRSFGYCEFNLLKANPVFITLYEKEIDGPGERELTFGDGLSILQCTALKWEDINGDYFIDSTDYAYFAEAWHSRPGDANWDERCDFYMDEYIDALDLASLCGSWLCYSYDCYCKLRE
jgi:hypothetical protein